MAELTRQDVFEIITDWFEQYGSAVGTDSVHELTAEELENIENIRILTIPGMVPPKDGEKERWVQTNFVHILRPINQAIENLGTAEQDAEDAAGAANEAADRVDASIEAAENATAAASKVNAVLSTQLGAVLLSVTNRNGETVTKEVGWRICKTYPSIAAMSADSDNVEEGRFVLISAVKVDPETGEPVVDSNNNVVVDTENHETGMTFVKNSNGGFTFITDLSGVQGIKGDTPVITADEYGVLYADGVKVTEIIKTTLATAVASFGALKKEMTDWWDGDPENQEDLGFRTTAEDWFDDAQENWSTFFGVDALHGVRKTFADWFSDTLATGVRKVWTTFIANVTAQWNSFYGENDNQEGSVRKIWGTLKTAVETATSAANTAAGAANTAAGAANDAAGTAGTNAAYAKEQGDYAKEQGDAIQELIDSGSLGGGASGGYAVCSTDSGVAAKTLTMTGFALGKNARISVVFTKGIGSLNSTLNINNGGAKSIKLLGSSIPGNLVYEDAIVTMVYDGTDWNVTNINNKEIIPVAAYEVDMGLPSGTKWCSRNVGANSEEGMGLLFSWANTQGHTSTDGYDWGTYSSTPGAQVTSTYVSGGTHDAARANMGGGWRVPTEAECQELIDNCTIAWVTQSSQRGLRFTSNINGKKLFFPACGWIDVSDNTLKMTNASAYYWSTARSKAIEIKEAGASVNSYGADYGFVIRAVK